MYRRRFCGHNVVLLPDTLGYPRKFELVVFPIYGDDTDGKLLVGELSLYEALQQLQALDETTVADFLLQYDKANKNKIRSAMRSFMRSVMASLGFIGE